MLEGFRKRDGQGSPERKGSRHKTLTVSQACGQAGLGREDSPMQTSSTDLLSLCDTVATAYDLKAEEDMGQKTATK